MRGEHRYGIGDPVEVKCVHIRKGPFWVPATVVFDTGGLGVGVAFADGERLAARRNLVRPAGKGQE